MAYLVEARFDTLPAEYYQTDIAHEGLATKLYESVGLFVLGHEYGHLLRGDLSGNGIASAVLGQKIQKIPHAWKPCCSSLLP